MVHNVLDGCDMFNHHLILITKNHNMKQFYALLLVLLTGCMMDTEHTSAVNLPSTTVTITEVTTGKHSRIIGSMLYNNILIPVRNSEPHGYTRYSLNEGSQVTTSVTVYTDTNEYSTQLWAETNFNTYSTNRK